MTDDGDTHTHTPKYKKYHIKHALYSVIVNMKLDDCMHTQLQFIL